MEINSVETQVRKCWRLQEDWTFWACYVQFMIVKTLVGNLELIFEWHWVVWLCLQYNSLYIGIGSPETSKNKKSRISKTSSSHEKHNVIFLSTRKLHNIYRGATVCRCCYGWIIDLESLLPHKLRQCRAVLEVTILVYQFVCNNIYLRTIWKFP